MDATSILRLALTVLVDRLILILSLGMACGLSCWSMWGPDWSRVATLGIFVLFSLLVVRRDRSEGSSKTTA